MRGARKIARQKNILLDENDLGNFVDLELYKPQTWSNLLEDKSLAALICLQLKIYKKNLLVKLLMVLIN